MFLSLAISQLLITTTTISYLSTQFVIAELFCNTGRINQYSHAFDYYRTYIEHQIPAQTDECLIRTKDKIGNVYTRIVLLK